jgi:hypothetical protein
MIDKTHPVAFQVLATELTEGDKPGRARGVWVNTTHHAYGDIARVERQRRNWPASPFKTRWATIVVRKSVDTYRPLEAHELSA